ncbi:AAA family ATPase [Nocardia sp. NPDC058379]|uniref:nucleotide-binding protein n=2 Tax=unclassified Nocardia TaxID=2637762 RepID=UPI00365502DE
MSRNNDSLPMLPPWLSESEVTQVGYEAPVENLPQDDLIDEAPKRRRFMGRGGNDDAKKDKRGRRRRGEDQPEQHQPVAEQADQRPPVEQRRPAEQRPPVEQPPARQPWPGEAANPLIPGDQPNGWQGGPAGPGTPPPWPSPHNGSSAAVPPAPGPSAPAPMGDPSIPTGPFANTPPSHGGPSTAPTGAHESSATAYADPTAQAGDHSGLSLPTRTPAPPSTGFTPLGPGQQQRQLPDLPPPPPLPDPPARPRHTEAPPRLTAPGEPSIGAHADPLLGPIPTPATESPVSSTTADPLLGPAPTTTGASAPGVDPLLAPAPTSTSGTSAPSVDPLLGRAPTTAGTPAPGVADPLVPPATNAATTASTGGASAGGWTMSEEAVAELRSPSPDARTPDQALSPDAARRPDPADVVPPESGEQTRTGRGRHSLDQPESAAAIGDAADATRTPPRLPEPPARLGDPAATGTSQAGFAPSPDATTAPPPLPEPPARLGVPAETNVAARDVLSPDDAVRRNELAPEAPVHDGRSSADRAATSQTSPDAFAAHGSTGTPSARTSPATGDAIASPRPASTSPTDDALSGHVSAGNAPSPHGSTPHDGAAPSTHGSAPLDDATRSTHGSAPRDGATPATHGSAVGGGSAEDSAPADRTTRMSLPTDLTGRTGPATASAPDSRSAYSAGEFTPSTGAGSPYRPGEFVAPPQAPGPDQPSHYVSQTPTYHSSQYNAMPGDPSPGAGTQSAPDAQTEMFRGDDPRVQAARNQAPGGEYAPPSWQSGTDQQAHAPQTGYRSGEFAQPANPYQQTPGQYQPGDPAQQLPESYHRPDGGLPQPDGAQPPQAEATRHYQQQDPLAPRQSQPDGSPARQYLPDGSPAPTHLRPDGSQQFLPDGSPAPTHQRSDGGQQFLPDGSPAPNFQYQQPGDVAPQQFQGGPTVAPYQQGPGQFQQPGQYQQPGWGANPQQGYQPPSLDNVPVKRVKKAPGSGWRKAVHHVSGGAINPGMSAEERRLQELVARIRQPVRGDYRIAVLSLKGGVGKTTTTTGLGSIFASIRGDRVIAVDANPDFGTLSQRVALQTRSTVRDLLLDPSIERYSDVRRHTSQSSSRLEVLASERDPAASESFNDEEYRAVARILQRFYNIILTDCGTGLMHSAMSGVLDLAHSLVLISSAAIDGARSAAATLDWLSLHGHDHLVRNAVVVINLPREGSPNVGVQQLREYFLSRCRAVHIIPFDEHLSEGAEIDLHRLHKTTKRAYVELAATVADEFGVDHHRFG